MADLTCIKPAWERDPSDPLADWINTQSGCSSEHKDYLRAPAMLEAAMRARLLRRFGCPARCNRQERDVPQSELLEHPGDGIRDISDAAIGLAIPDCPSAIAPAIVSL
jgi:hypothetical protein